MPTTYAHYRFGRDVLPLLSPEAQKLVRTNLDLYNFGVHGPDVLFYYRPLGKNDVNQTGYNCHKRTGRAFFTQAARTVARSETPEASQAYLFGVLCHFALDRYCHPYVGQKEQDGVSHSLIESSFDRYLMLLDGLDPVKHVVTGHLHPGMDSARVMSPFYPPVTAEEVLGAQKQMILALNILVAKGLKRKALVTAMKAAGRGHMEDMFVPYTRDPRCADSDEILLEHYQEALSHIPEMVQELTALLSGAGELGPCFDHTFGET